MQLQIFKDIGQAFSPDLPQDLGNMDDHLDFIVPKVIPFGEDLAEDKFWVGKRWLEVRDDEGFHESILHLFNEGGEYMLSLDGNIVRGTWKKLGQYNTLILELSGRSELFDLRFLSAEFMVLTKHGDQARKGLRRYFCLIHEPSLKSGGRVLDWRHVMEKMFNIWRSNSLSLWAWFIFIMLLVLVIYLSFN